jgi:protocatechuate 3,4-dioxygenase beta subunit
VEIWHADAAGTYSGVQGNSGNFLRGGQKSDAAGKVRFDTIFPGWYRGRTLHIHMKVFVSGSSLYAQGVYARRGQNDTSNAADRIFVRGRGRALRGRAPRSPADCRCATRGS